MMGQTLALGQRMARPVAATMIPQAVAAGQMQAIRFTATPQPLGVTTRREGPTQYITLSRAEAGNRITEEMLYAMERFFDAADTDPAVKTIVFESTDKRFFSPGLDIFPIINGMKQTAETLDKRLKRLPKPLRKAAVAVAHYFTLRNYITRGFQFYDRIAESSKVTVAKVNGYTLGAASELSLACDYIVASDKATFGLPEVKYGLFPAWGGAERLPQRVGKSLAKFVILEGGLMSDQGGQGPAIIKAADAQEMGLFDAVVPPADLDRTVREGLQPGGAFTAKRVRPGTGSKVALMDETIRPRLQNPVLVEKFQRYQSATLEELLQQELKGIAKPALALAIKRIENGPAVSRLTHERDLVKMMRYFSQWIYQPS